MQGIVSKLKILANWWNMSYGFIFDKKNQIKGKKIKSFARSELHTLVEMTYMKNLFFLASMDQKII